MKTSRLILLITILGVPHAHAQEGAAQSSPFSQSKFVPDISLILDGSYVIRDRAQDFYESLQVPGIGHADQELHPNAGFNLNFAEVTFYSVVDPYAELFAVLHLSEEHFGLEEAYGLSRSLPGGFQLKFGKFLSGFGRINEKHVHTWDFADMPLINRLVFGDEGLNEVGARVTWVAPLDTYLMFGGEVLQGNNEVTFGTSGFSDPFGSLAVSQAARPALFLGYVKTSVDIDDAVVLLGVSGARGTTRKDEDFSSGGAQGSAFSGKSTVLGGDLTVTYLLDPIRSISFQSEFIWKKTSGTSYVRDSSLITQRGIDFLQSGIYAQLVAKLDLRWRAGIRLDYLPTIESDHRGIVEGAPDALTRFSGMVEFNPTEFSRIRLQYNHDQSKYDVSLSPAKRTVVNELILQVNLAIGAHGAHSF